MRLYLATSNQGKLREIKALFSHFDVQAYSDIIEPFEIIEDAPTFQGNAILKSEAVYHALKDDEAVVIADDSGISVDVLNGEPGIFSARYAGEDASDKDNLHKVIDEVKKHGVQSSPAHYTAAIALTSKYGTVTVHGWMYGMVTTTPKGDGGFGYDPIFIPENYTQTLGELSHEIKATLSHRSQALQRLELIIKGMHFN